MTALGVTPLQGTPSYRISPLWMLHSHRCHALTSVTLVQVLHSYRCTPYPYRCYTLTMCYTLPLQVSHPYRCSILTGVTPCACRTDTVTGGNLYKCHNFTALQALQHYRQISRQAPNCTVPAVCPKEVEKGQGKHPSDCWRLQQGVTCNTPCFD